MKTYKEFNEAAALVLPALKAAPYVIPALGAGANILKGMMQSDASDRFKARQRPGRTSSVSDRQREQARQDRRAEAQLRARENTPKDKPTVENVPTAKKEKKEKVDPRLERAAGQILDRLRNEEVQSEGMLPVPSMARRLMNNPPIPQQDKEDKFKKQFDKKFKGFDKKIRDLRKELKANNKHRDEKLNYQYKDVTNPKRPSDPVKDLKKKGTA